MGGVGLVSGVALLSVPPTSGLPYGTVWLYVAVTGAFSVTSAVLHTISSLQSGRP